MKVSATSFSKIYNPSMSEIEQWYINDHCIVHDRNNTWHLFGITHPEPANPLDEKFFAHATSKELCATQWEKHPQLLHADYDTWKETHVWAPHVIFHNDMWYMFYCAGGDSHDRYKIHLATSHDLWNWTRHPANPMVVDGFDARDPMVFSYKNEWILYYTATSEPEGGNHIVAAVTSCDLINWKDKRVVFVSEECGTYAGNTESPFVIERRGKFYLFVCTNAPYNTTEVYESETPFVWEKKKCVGYIPAHAAEIISIPEKDKYYISRAGWGEGGVYVAELHWE